MSEKQKALECFSIIVDELDDDTFERLRSKLELLSSYIRNSQEQ